MRELITKEMIKQAYGAGVLTLVQDELCPGEPVVCFRIGDIVNPVGAREDPNTGEWVDEHLDRYLAAVSVDEIVEDIYGMLEEYGREAEEGTRRDEYLKIFSLLSEELQMWPEGFVEDFVREQPGLVKAAVEEMDLEKLTRDELRAMRDQIDGVLAQKEKDLPLSTTIYFTTTEGPDATQFDTQDMAELLELFHMLLEENGLKLVSIDGIETVVDQDRVREAAGVSMNEKLSERSISMDGGKVSEEQVVSYLKRWGHPHPEEDGTLDEFMNGEERQWMYDEAVRNDYDFPDMDRWICLVNALGAEISFDAAMAIEGALYEEDLDSHEFERAEDLLNTPRGVCGDMLRVSLGMGDGKGLPEDVRLVEGEKDLEALRGVFGALLERDFEDVLKHANERYEWSLGGAERVRDGLGDVLRG